MTLVQVSRDANNIKLQKFLRDKLRPIGILVFEVRKFREMSGRSSATLTVANLDKGHEFL